VSDCPFTRYALVPAWSGELEPLARYLPGNYRVEARTSFGVVISGRDSAGWTLHGYVLPRLASGLIAVEEIDLSHPAMREVPAWAG
jgi:hypothetical protein